MLYTLSTLYFSHLKSNSSNSSNTLVIIEQCPLSHITPPVTYPSLTGDAQPHPERAQHAAHMHSTLRSVNLLISQHMPLLARNTLLTYASARLMISHR